MSRTIRPRPPQDLEPSEQLSCPHRPPCPGCPRFGESGLGWAAHDALDSLARLHGLPPVAVTSGPGSGFRLRARLAIRGRIGSPKLGLFELDTHRVVHIPTCMVHHPLINRVADVVRRALVEAKISSYSDGAHLGLARYLQVVVERSSQSAQVVLVGNCATVEPLARCFELIRDRLGRHLHSLWFNSNCERSNSILGSKFQQWSGPHCAVERFGGGPTIHYPPGAFGQSNLDMAEAIVEHVRARVPDGVRVAEFYAGVGAIGLSVVDKTAALSLNEVAPQSLLGLELGVANLDAAYRSRVSVVPGPAGAACAAALDADVVIVDPPRKGLDHDLIEFLANHPPQRLIYVSCDAETLMSDVSRLIEGSRLTDEQRRANAGRLRLTQMQAFNQMPYTEHVETVAILDRAAILDRVS